MNNLVIDNYEINVLSNNFEKAQIKILKNTTSRLILNSNEFNELEIELIKVLDKKIVPYYSCI